MGWNKPYAQLSEHAKELSRAAGRRWYQRNKQRKLAANRSWRGDHSEQFRASRLKNVRKYRAEGRYRDRIRRWEVKNLAKRTKQATRLHRFKYYGITEERFYELLEMQAGLCAICCEPMRPGKGTCVDHDHKTGKVRGLTCPRCNLSLGHIESRPLMVEDALAYLAVNG